MYDICSCVVALGGDVRQTVPKPIVTVPEILLLQSIHGGDAITNIIITGQEKRTDESIRDELGVMYKDDVVNALFGNFNDLPKTLVEAKIGDELLDPVWKTNRKNAAEKSSKKKATKKRARDSAGHFIPDDPSTPNVNEAYVEG
tara:strand:+ start:7249 stop:7680 length:432 start_codon:yes stop_codon:yes gene_type:complete